MASRVAAELRKDGRAQVELVKGGLGEFTVAVDGREVARSSRFWYPNPAKVVAQVRQALDRADAS